MAVIRRLTMVLPVEFYDVSQIARHSLLHPHRSPIDSMVQGHSALHAPLAQLPPSKPNNARKSSGNIVDKASTTTFSIFRWHEHTVTFRYRRLICVCASIDERRIKRLTCAVCLSVIGRHGRYTSLDFLVMHALFRYLQQTDANKLKPEEQTRPNIDLVIAAFCQYNINILALTLNPLFTALLLTMPRVFAPHLICVTLKVFIRFVAWRHALVLLTCRNLCASNKSKLYHLLSS